MQMKEPELYQCFLAIIVIYGVWLLILRLFSTGKVKNLPPSPPKLPIIGNLHQIGPLPHRSLASLSKKYGPLLYLQLGHKPLLLISSAALTKEIVKNHDIPFSGKPLLLATNKLLLGRKGLIFSQYGDHWRKLRSIVVNQLLHKRVSKSFQAIRDEEISSLVEYIDKHSSASAPVNLTAMFLSLANDVICKSAFGDKYNNGEEGIKIIRVIEEVTKLLFTFTVGEFIPWLAWTNRWNGFDATLDRVSRDKDEIISRRIREYFRNSDESNIPAIVVDLYKGNISGIANDMDTLQAIIQDLLGAGTDTTATSLAWAMTELIRHPKVMKKLQDEITEVMTGKQNITDEDLEKMPYLKAVIKESLRLHAPVPIGLRETNENIRLMGYDIPAGMMVLFNLWAICRDPTCWKEPEKFLPDRFLHSSMDYTGLDFEFIPFGAGRRICPGVSFATATIEHVLANLIHKFNWQLPNGARGEDLDVIEKPGLAVGRENPLVVVPSKRCF